MNDDYKAERAMRVLEDRLTHDRSFTEAMGDIGKAILAESPFDLAMFAGLATLIVAIGVSNMDPIADEVTRLNEDEKEDADSGSAGSLSEDHSKAISIASEKTGVPEGEIELLLISAKDNPHRQDELDEGKYGLIPLSPFETGGTPELLEDAEYNLTAAAMIYGGLKDKYGAKKAAAVFFAGRERVIDAMDQSRIARDIMINTSTRSNYSGYTSVRELKRMVETTRDPELKKRYEKSLMQRLDADRARKERLEHWKRQSFWQNNINEPYAKRATKIFLANHRNYAKK